MTDEQKELEYAELCLKIDSIAAAIINNASRYDVVNLQHKVISAKLETLIKAQEKCSDSVEKMRRFIAEKFDNAVEITTQDETKSVKTKINLNVDCLFET